MKGVKAKGSERSEGPSLNYEKTTQPLPSSQISELWESAQNLVAPSSVARQACCRANGSPKQPSLGKEGRWRDKRPIAPLPLARQASCRVNAPLKHATLRKRRRWRDRLLLSCRS